MYSDQQTVVIEPKPAVKIQSASASPGIVIAPGSVVQVPMPDDGKRWTKSTMQDCLVRRPALTVPEEEHIHLLSGHI